MWPKSITSRWEDHSEELEIIVESLESPRKEDFALVEQVYPLIAMISQSENFEVSLFYFISFKFTRFEFVG